MGEMNERQSDFEWLQQFARAGNQTAFRDIVRRHIDLVFATALRKVGDAGGAQEISQNVFTALARKAWRFAPDDSLPAWLHKTTLLESKSWLRGELRRRRREQTAVELGTTMNTPDEQPAFNALVPMLDEALLSLREKDRTALLLRYYESHSLRDVGAALGVSDDTAQKRVASALEKLSEFFQRQGFKTATVAATAAALQHTASSASAATVSIVANIALQAAPSALVGLGAVVARLASLSKLQTAAICLAVIAAPMAWQWNEKKSVNEESLQLQTQLAARETELATLQAEIEKSKASSAQRESELAEATTSATKRAANADKFEAWKKRIREQLLAANYQWPEDSPFVKIPKRALPDMDVSGPVRQPGVIAREARELLGLSPVERQQAEDTLHRHFEKMDSMAAQNFYQTNHTSHVNIPIPANSLAANVWVVPALGDEAAQQAQQFISEFLGFLGEERGKLIERALGSTGMGTFQSILALDADKSQRELSAIIRDFDGEPMITFNMFGGLPFTGAHWSSGGATIPLKGFLGGVADDQTNPIASLSWIQEMDFFSPSVKQSVIEWAQQQAQAQLGKETSR
jgi:RNA polymerase sigma factor (sigma-70 family)